MLPRWPTPYEGPSVEVIDVHYGTTRDVTKWIERGCAARGQMRPSVRAYPQESPGATPELDHRYRRADHCRVLLSRSPLIVIHHPDTDPLIRPPNPRPRRADATPRKGSRMRHRPGCTSSRPERRRRHGASPTVVLGARDGAACALDGGA